MKIKVDKCLIELAKIFGEDNPLFIVGGYIRDQIIGIKNSDIDLACNLNLQDLQKLLKNTNYSVKVKNKNLGTAIISFKDKVFEYSTFRKESYLGFGEHSPNSIIFDASIIEDASRRDFTMNAIYYKILTKEIFDFYGGVRDILNKCIRTVETPELVLKNDGLRILRMIRFASELNFFIDNETFAAANKYVSNLNNISQDRLRDEFFKIIYANKSNAKVLKRNTCFSKNLAYNGIKLMDKLNIWSYIVKKDKEIMGCLQGVGAHLNTFLKSKNKDLLLSFCLDSYLYINKYKKIISEKQFCSSFLGINGLKINKVEYQDIYQKLLNLIKIIDLHSASLDKLKVYVLTNIEDKHCAEMRLLKVYDYKKYMLVRSILKTSHKYPTKIQDLDFDIQSFINVNKNFDKKNIKGLLNKLQTQVLLDKVENTSTSLNKLANEIINKKGENK